jgi:hypothetical protein
MVVEQLAHGVARVNHINDRTLFTDGGDGDSIRILRSGYAPDAACRAGDSLIAESGFRIGLV